MAEWLGRRTSNPEVSGSSLALPGPDCIKKLKIKKEFLRLFTALWKIFRIVIVFPMLFNPPTVDLSIIAC